MTISEKMVAKKQITVTPEENQGRYILGVQPGSVRLSIHVCWWFTTAADSGIRILSALKNLIFHPDLNKLGGPLPFLRHAMLLKNGLENVLYFPAMISINIGILTDSDSGFGWKDCAQYPRGYP